MWDSIESALSGTLGWIVRHPRITLGTVVVILWFVARAFVLYVVNQLLLLILLLWGLALISGYGRVWGKGKKKD
jgi:hypothetical protein